MTSTRTKRLPFVLGVLSAVWSVLVVRPVNSYQGFMFKATATAQTPALTVLGALTRQRRMLRHRRSMRLPPSASAALDARRALLDGSRHRS